MLYLPSSRSFICQVRSIFLICLFFICFQSMTESIDSMGMAENKKQMFVQTCMYKVRMKNKLKDAINFAKDKLGLYNLERPQKGKTFQTYLRDRQDMRETDGSLSIIAEVLKSSFCFRLGNKFSFSLFALNKHPVGVTLKLPSSSFCI